MTDPKQTEPKLTALELRQKWTTWIITMILVWISFLIGFNILLTAFVGWHIMDFTGREWFITAVIVGSFLQIAGMGYVAVKFLFGNTNDS